MLRLQPGLQAAHGADRHDAFHAQRFQRVDVGAEGQFRRADPMAPAVARQEGHRHVQQLAYRDNVAGLPVGRVDVHHGGLGKPLDFVEAAAADDGDFRLRNGWALGWFLGRR